MNSFLKFFGRQSKEFQIAFVKQLLQLVTTGFGLVAALAWNNVITAVIDKYINKFFGNLSGIISLSLYAVVITLLAVLITFNLSKLEGRLENSK